MAARLRELSTPETGIGGNILVAGEGISGAIAAPAGALAAFERALHEDPAFAGAFAGLVFKHSACATRPFTLIKVHCKPEIVAFGVPGVSGLPDPELPDTHVSPQRWRELISEPDVLVLDNRNSFEYRLGRFKNAIDPEVAHFRDFPAYVAAHAEAWKPKASASPCTAPAASAARRPVPGCRARASMSTSSTAASSVISSRCPMRRPTGRGECFVFDKRMALDTRLQETATTAEQVYGDDPKEAWRLARARRLDPSS